MQDRFKFRAWDKKLNCMCFADAGTNYFYMFQDDSFIVMQCTGLKDKNGKLIYERDIVKYKKNPVERGTGIIQYHSCYFSLDFMELGKYEDSGCSLTKNTTDYIQLEVIGNIYENKELLEVKNA